MGKNHPVAVFDSGVGGISVLRKLIDLMPQENYLYFGDRQNAPYGNKTAAEVCCLTEKAVHLLLEKQAKAIVLACNTATSAGATHLRELHPDIPIIGMEPAIKPAALACPGGRIIVLATAMTLREHKFAELLEKYSHMANFTPLPAPGIVEAVEKGDIDGTHLAAYLEELLAPYREAPPEGIVLGCTHFPLASAAIRKALGHDVPFFDGAEGTAKETQRQLAARQLLSDRTGQGCIEFCGSGTDEASLELYRKLLGK